MNKALLVLLILFSNVIWAQTRKDSVLMNERSIDRPVTLHKGQFRISGGYGLSIITKRFDDSGDAIRLSEEGLSSVRHSFIAEMKYGILNFLEFQTVISRQSQAIREQNILILSDPSTNSNTVKEYIGMEDIYVGINARYPFKTKKIDVELLSGISLPTANGNPDKPSNTLTRINENGFDAVNIEYRYNYNLGNGIPVAQLGGLVKYRMPNIAFSTQVLHRHGLEDGESYDWISQIDNNDQFHYRKDPYSFRLPDRLNYYVEVEFQPAPWFNFILNASGLTTARGWMEEDGVRTAIPDASLFSINPGFEILVTSKLWLRQRVLLPVSGKNYESATSFLTTISYNFFPF